MDKHLKMVVHIFNICKAAWHNLYKIGKIRSYLTQDQTKAVVHAYVTSKVDMNKSLLVGTSASQLQKLQRIQNAMARLICRSKQHEHITPVLKSLHWLPIHMGLIFRLLLLVFKALHNAGPVYRRDLLHVYSYVDIPGHLLMPPTGSSII